MGGGGGGHLVFQNEATNIPSQVFVMMDISCEFEMDNKMILVLEGKLFISLVKSSSL